MKNSKVRRVVVVEYEGMEKPLIFVASSGTQARTIAAMIVFEGVDAKKSEDKVKPEKLICVRLDSYAEAKGMYPDILK